MLHILFPRGSDRCIVKPGSDPLLLITQRSANRIAGRYPLENFPQNC